MFYYADEFNISWLPTLRRMWSPVGQQVMINTPHQPYKRYGLGAVNYHSGETVVIFRQHKRRKEVAELLQALLEKHLTETIYVAWDNCNTHEDNEVEAVVRGAAGRLILLYLPTYSPWLNPIEMLWRHFRREVTHCELFASMKALLQATTDFFVRYNAAPDRILSIIGAHPKQSLCLYLVDDHPDFSGLETGRSALRPYKNKGRHVGLPLQKPTEFRLVVY